MLKEHESDSYREGLVKEKWDHKAICHLTSCV